MFQWAKFHNWPPVHILSDLNINDKNSVILFRKDLDYTPQGPSSSWSFRRHNDQFGHCATSFLRSDLEPTHATTCAKSGEQVPVPIAIFFLG